MGTDTTRCSSARSEVVPSSLSEPCRVHGGLMCSQNAATPPRTSFAELWAPTKTGVSLSFAGLSSQPEAGSAAPPAGWRQTSGAWRRPQHHGNPRSGPAAAETRSRCTAFALPPLCLPNHRDAGDASMRRVAPAAVSGGACAARLLSRVVVSVGWAGDRGGGELNGKRKRKR